MKVRGLNASVISAGLALTWTFGAAPAAATTNLLANGSSESGDFSGWSVLNTSFPPIEAVGAVGDIAPEDGKFQAVLHGGGLQITQTIMDSAGQHLAFSAWYVSLNLSGNVVFSIDGNPHQVATTSQSYQEIQFGFTASGSDTLLIVIGETPALFVDNLSIVPAVGAAGTPEMSTWAMMFIGFGGISLAGYRARRRRLKSGGISGQEDAESVAPACSLRRRTMG